MVLQFKCPDCGRKLSPVSPMNSATQVVRRLCKSHLCRSQWQLVVRVLKVGDALRADAATFTYLGRVLCRKDVS